jgi:hypothetical protein
VARRSLWPREHGAYVQLLAPLGTALIVRAPTAAAALLAVAACAAFLANEPLLVVLGHRGARMRETDGARAKRRLAITAAIALAAGAGGLALATGDARVMAAAAAVPAIAMVALAWTRSEHSLAGELVAAVALPGAAAAVVVASGAAIQTAARLWAAWAVGFACTVIAVHRVIARHRKPATSTDHAIAALLLATAAALTATAFVGAPLAAAAFVLALRPPSASHLRAIGVALVVASIASGALAVALV